MCINGETIEMLAHVAVKRGVFSQQLTEFGTLIVVRQLTEDQQLRRLDEGGASGKVLDGDPAVPEDPTFTIDEGDGRTAGPCIAVGIVESNETSSCP